MAKKRIEYKVTNYNKYGEVIEDLTEYSRRELTAEKHPELIPVFSNLVAKVAERMANNAEHAV